MVTFVLAQQAVVHEHAGELVADDPVQQQRLPFHLDLGVAELANIAALHRAAQLVKPGLHTVADAQYRHSQFEYRLRRAASPFGTKSVVKQQRAA